MLNVPQSRAKVSGSACGRSPVALGVGMEAVRRGVQRPGVPTRPPFGTVEGWLTWVARRETMYVYVVISELMARVGERERGRRRHRRHPRTQVHLWLGKPFFWNTTSRAAVMIVLFQRAGSDHRLRPSYHT